jgi:hypothetical protein
MGSRRESRHERQKDGTGRSRRDRRHGRRKDWHGKQKREEAREAEETGGTGSSSDRPGEKMKQARGV